MGTAPAPHTTAFAQPFLSLDGPDGAGKSTQCRLLAGWFRERGYAVTECTDPGGTEVGNVIRDLLLDRGRVIALRCEALLFMASRAQLAAEVLRPALESGRVVIADRFLLANVVYQGHAGGLDPAFLWEVGRFASERIEPDLTLLLDLPVEEAFARKRVPPDRLESRDLAFHEKVRQGFLSEGRRNPGRMRLVDARQSMEAVHRQIIEEVSHFLEAGPRP